MLLTFDQNMALIYLLMLSTYYYWYTHDKNITLPIEKSSSGRFTSMLYAVAVLVGFLVVASSLGQSVQSVISIFGTAAPVFAGNIFLTIVAWGILIPIIETALFFGIFYEGLAFYAGRFMRVGPIDTKLSFNPFLIGIMIAVAGIFTAYHFQTRGLTDNIGLGVTFIFAFISCMTVSFFGHTREAILLHIYVNTMAVVQQI